MKKVTSHIQPTCLLLTILMAIIYQSGFAQDDQIRDSLLNELKITIVDTAKVKLLIDLNIYLRGKKK